MFRLKQPPQTLVELAESLKVLETLQGDLAKTEAQIPLIHDQFAILDKYEVSVEQTVSTSLINEQKYIQIHCTGYKGKYLDSVSVFVNLSKSDLTQVFCPRQSFKECAQCCSHYLCAFKVHLHIFVFLGTKIQTMQV